MYFSLGNRRIQKKIFNHVDRRQFLKSSVVLGALSAITGPAVASPAVSQGNDREYWVPLLTRIAGPVLKSLSERKLKAEMPVEAPHGNTADRRQYTYLEAMGRLLTGIAPWLESVHTAAGRRSAASMPSGHGWPLRRVQIRHRQTS